MNHDTLLQNIIHSSDTAFKRLYYSGENDVEITALCIWATRTVDEEGKGVFLYG